MTFEQERLTHIGASDVGPIMGVSPYKSVFDVFLEKLGMEEPEVNEAMQTGTDIEKWIVTERYIPRMKKEGEDIRVIKPPFYEHPDYPFLGCHCDGLVFAMDGKYRPYEDLSWALPKVQRDAAPPLHGLEVKNSSEYARSFYGDEYTDAIPESYVLQCQISMEIVSRVFKVDIDRWDVAVMIGGNKFRLYRVMRSPEMIANAIPILKDFWDRVQNNDPPPADGSPEYVEFLSKWFHKEEEVTIESDPELDQYVSGYCETRDHRDQLVSSMVEHEAAICERMENATRLIGPDYVVTWKFPASQTRIKHKELLVEAKVPQELIEKHQYKTQPKKRSFRVKRKEKEVDVA